MADRQQGAWRSGNRYALPTSPHPRRRLSEPRDKRVTLTPHWYKTSGMPKGWTQTDLAVHLDLSRGHISDIELGKREAGLITLQIIARGLNTNMATLLKNL